MLENINEDIYEIYYKNEYIENKTEKHNTIQNDVYLLAKKYNCKGVKEYRVDYNGYLKHEYRKGKVDVVWINENKEIVLAFEVDSSIRPKSLIKLNNIDSKYKIWLCYGKDINKLNRYVKELDANKNINILLTSK